jgi:branched-chain amino acid transport system ATP-binding protein
LLKVRQLSSFYGPIQVLRDVSLDVAGGEAVAVLGPNGAGKSTLLRSISGLLRARKGSITYQGHEIAQHPPHAVVKLGIVHVPEGRRIFSQLSVTENLLMGAYTVSDQMEVREHLEFVFSLFPDLAEKKGQLGGELSGGQQQMLAVGRALMGRPSLLLLDEPSLGLSPIMVERLGETIASIRRDLGTSILIVEQNAGLAMELASRIYVMETGRITLSGATGEISTEQLRAAYLGQGSPARQPDGALPPAPAPDTIDNR